MSQGCHTHYHHIVTPTFFPDRCQNMVSLVSPSCFIAKILLTLLLSSHKKHCQKVADTPPYVGTSTTCLHTCADSYFTSWNFGFSIEAIIVSCLSPSTNPSLSLSFISPFKLYMYLYQVINIKYYLLLPEPDQTLADMWPRNYHYS